MKTKKLKSASKAKTAKSFSPKKYLFLSVLTMIFILFYQYIFDSKLDLNGDNANYIALARNMVKGLGYSSVGINGVVPASHFPPGYSAFLSFFMFFGIDNLVFFKVLNGILLFLSLATLFYLTGKIKNNTVLAFACATVAIFSPQTLHFASMAMSEMLFLFCCVACFFSLWKYSENTEKRFWTSPYFYLAIAFAVAAYYIRTVAAALILGVIVFFLFRKEWRQTLAAAGGVLLLVGLWSLRNAHFGIKSRYFGTIMTVNPWRPELGTISSTSEMIEKMITNFDETVIKGFREILFPFLKLNYQEPSGFWAVVAGLLVVAVVFYGAWNFGKLRWVLITFILGHIGLFMLWHGGNGSRYVVPIAPVLFFTFYNGIFSLIRLFLKKENAFTTNLPYTFLFIILPMFSPIKLQAKEAQEPFPPAYQNYFRMAQEMKRQVGESVVVSCRKPELFQYFADNVFAVHYTFTQNADEMIADMLAKKVDYVILEQLGYSSTGLYLYPAITANVELFTLVWQLPNPNTYLLKFEKEKAAEKLQKNAQTTIEK